MVRRLEALGAAVESEQPGEAFFAIDGLRGIHGGDSAGVLAAARAGARARRGDPDRHRAEPLRRFRRGLEGGRGAGAAPARLPRPDLGRDPAAASRGAGARGRGAGRHLGAARDQDAAGALADLRRPGRRPLRAARPAGPPPRPRRGRAVAPAHAARGTGRADRAAGGNRRQPARARPGAAGRPPAGGAPAPRPHPARPAPRGAAQRRRQLERRAGAGAADRFGPHPALAAGAAAGGAAGAGDGAAAAGARARAGSRATRSSSRSAARSRAAAGSAPRCARSARPRAPRRC